MISAPSPEYFLPVPRSIGIQGLIEFVNYSDVYVQLRSYQPGFTGWTSDMLLLKKRSYAIVAPEPTLAEVVPGSTSLTYLDMVIIRQISIMDPNVYTEILIPFTSVYSPVISTRDDLVKILNGWFNGGGVPISVNGGTVVDPLYGINFIEGANINIVVAGNLTTNQTDVTISAAGGAGGFSYVTIPVNTTPYTVVPVAGWYMYLVDATAGAITMNFPSAVANNAVYTVKKVDNSANTVILTPNGAQTIDGAATQTIRFQNTSVDIYSDNANLYIM